MEQEGSCAADRHDEDEGGRANRDPAAARGPAAGAGAYASAAGAAATTRSFPR